jgi:signal transduction histidine kinase
MKLSARNEAANRRAGVEDERNPTACEYADGAKFRHPREVESNDPEVLRAALIRESCARGRAECRANMQAEVVQLALDLLVREPDIEGFFGALSKTMVEETESYTCAVWLIDEDLQRCDLWMAYVKDQLLKPRPHEEVCGASEEDGGPYPCASMAKFLFEHSRGWTETVEYTPDDPQLPEPIREFGRRNGLAETVATPLLLGTRTLGWMTVCSTASPEPDSRWWRVVLIEAIAHQAALALHHSRLVDMHRREERRKGILEERNRLARDIHDNLAQGFAAILMQLQAAQREGAGYVPAVRSKIDTAIDLARTHLTEARRSVGALRPNVGSSENVATALKRLADLSQRTTTVPIDLVVEELPRFGDGVEREILAIAQEALTNAVRHSNARRIVISASTAQSVGFRLSVADDGRGIAREPVSSGFGMTSMHERAERIGASLTIVTAPRNGTEVVLAWQPSSLPTQIHAAN